MALMFQRLARNFIKNGYFPTDAVSLSRILAALDSDGEKLRIIDPCCGEGVALAEVKQHLVALGASVEALGIEYDRERGAAVVRVEADKEIADAGIVQRLRVTPAEAVHVGGNRGVERHALGQANRERG